MWLVFNSDGVGVGVVSGVTSATESESHESERFHFLPTPLTTPSLTFRLWSSENRIVVVGSRSWRTNQSQCTFPRFVIGLVLLLLLPTPTINIHVNNIHVEVTFGKKKNISFSNWLVRQWPILTNGKRWPDISVARMYSVVFSLNRRHPARPRCGPALDKIYGQNPCVFVWKRIHFDPFRPSVHIRWAFSSKTHRFENTIESEWKRKRAHIVWLVWTVENASKWERRPCA